jgi:hypothetical protein
MLIILPDKNIKNVCFKIRKQTFPSILINLKPSKMLIY